ncbi:hypothetical protein NHX12_034123 [Muraenolepis orangiensis]|uniref:Uncharacterized protein n=1 Tax=Muraenolepis orangiensis TaxID=630683 RepID=A0A9Q0E5B3_9TELE|nr:hypothetical protein NHX12_034123 [Muraenolepis orangiensis]
MGLIKARKVGPYYRTATTVSRPTDSGSLLLQRGKEAHKRCQLLGRPGGRDSDADHENQERCDEEDHTFHRILLDSPGFPGQVLNMDVTLATEERASLHLLSKPTKQIPAPVNRVTRDVRSTASHHATAERLEQPRELFQVLLKRLPGMHSRREMKARGVSLLSCDH